MQDTSTEFERTVSRLLQLKQGRDSGAISMLWRNPVVCYSKHGLGKPLTSLTSDALQTEATKLAKVILLYTRQYNQLFSSATFLEKMFQYNP